MPKEQAVSAEKAKPRRLEAPRLPSSLDKKSPGSGLNQRPCYSRASGNPAASIQLRARRAKNSYAAKWFFCRGGEIPAFAGMTAAWR